MRFLLLVARFAARNRSRFLPTAAAVGIVLLAFVVLRATASTWHQVEISEPDRMVVRNRTSVTFPLFKSQLEKVSAVPGVLDVSWSNWFGGVYKDEHQTFPRLAVDAKSYLRLYPQFGLSADELQAWLDDPTGAIAGPELAQHYRWHVGDKIAMQGTIYPGVWEFHLRGIYQPKAGASKNNFLFHWKYLNEKVEPTRREQLGSILVRVENPDVGRAIDAQFANSNTETRTESQEAFARERMKSAASLISAIEIASFAVVVILILIVGNAMAMATRERTTEYAAMRAIGYRSRHIIRFVLAEGFLVAGVGAMLGLLAAPLALASFETLVREQMGYAWHVKLDLPTSLLALGVAIVSGMCAAAIPALKVGRLRIVDALRRVE
jgi:putative ABC transport system permease protein